MVQHDMVEGAEKLKTQPGGGAPQLDYNMLVDFFVYIALNNIINPVWVFGIIENGIPNLILCSIDVLDSNTTSRLGLFINYTLQYDISLLQFSNFS